MSVADETAKPFNGKNLDGWKQKGPATKSHLTVGTAKLSPKNAREFVVSKNGHELINAKGGGIDFYSEAIFGDAIIEVEVMVPQGSNSGVYVMGEYEIQVLDSYGRKKLGGGDMGAIYGAAPPRQCLQETRAMAEVRDPFSRPAFPGRQEDCQRKIPEGDFKRPTAARECGNEERHSRRR